MANTVQNLPAMQEIQVQSLGQEDPLEKEMATHSSILAWGNPMDRGAWQATMDNHEEEPDRSLTVHGVSNSWTQLSK